MNINKIKSKSKIQYIALILIIKTIFSVNALSMNDNSSTYILNLPTETISEIIDKVIEDNIASWNDIFKWSKTRNNLSKDLLNIFLTCKQLSAFNTEYLKNKIKKLKDIRFKYLKDKLTKQVIDKYNINSKNTLNNKLFYYLNAIDHNNSQDYNQYHFQETINLILAGADINMQDRFNNTALIIAIERKQKDVVEMLLYQNADVEIQNNLGKTPLMEASEIGNLDIIKLLIKYGSNVNAQGIFNRTALIYAAFSSINNQEIVKLLLDNGADINHCDNKKNTALTYAIIDGNKNMVEALIKYNANINNKDLICASNYGHNDIERLLKQYI